MEDNNNFNSINYLNNNENNNENNNNESNEPNSPNSPISPISIIINQYDIIYNQQDNLEQDNLEQVENSEEHYADNEHEEPQEQYYDIYYHPLNFISNLININPNSNIEINERVNILMEEGSNKLFTTPEDLMSIIEISYLGNLQYTDELSNLIKYTIRNIFRDTHQYQISDVIGGILTYSLSQNNVVFNDNYTIVYEILLEEIKRLISRSYTFMLLSNMIIGNPPHGNQMENVKLTVKPEIIEGITQKKFKEYESNIKEVNIKCTVCQACFEGEDDTRILKCNHVYHTDCIDNWLTNYNYLCPCCREPAAEHFANLS